MNSDSVNLRNIANHTDYRNTAIMTTNSPQSANPAMSRLRNFLIALAAIALSIALFIGLQTQNPSSSLSQMAEDSTPLEVALGNGKPTLIEFYANWCTSCQAMAADLAELKATYAEPLNFVMLNVDNSKWLPEILHYRVDGIPHFVFLDSQGNSVAQAIGEQPHSILEDNLQALIAAHPLPYAVSTGQVSNFTAPVSAAKTSATAPKSHGAQVQ